MVAMRARTIAHLIEVLGDRLYQKEEVLRLALLGALAGESVFLYGPTGVAKSLIARRLTQAFQDAKRFEYVLGPYTTPEELFGPVSLAAIRDHDRYERIIEGYLPDAEVVFLDGIWRAGSAIQNTLLAAVHDGVFRNGAQEIRLPMKLLIGADDHLPAPEDDLDIFLDNFTLRLAVEPVTERAAFMALLEDTRDPATDVVPPGLKITTADLETWREEARSVIVPDQIKDLVYDIRERILRHNRHHRREDQSQIFVSDRRWKQAMNLLRMSAYLNEHDAVDPLDCIVLRHCLWNGPDQIEPINTIVGEALHRYSRSGRFNPQTMHERLARVAGDLQSVAVATEEKTIEKPLCYRDEYYRLVDFSDESEVLIWIGDYEQLSTKREIDTDLFFYSDDDEYAYSERVPIRKISSYELEINGQPSTIETTSTREDVETPIELSTEEKKTWTATLADMEKEIDEIIGQIISYRDSSSGDANSHLFVHRRYAQIVTDGMNEVAGDFNELKADIETARSRVENRRE